MMNIFESEETLKIFQPEALKPDGPEPFVIKESYKKNQLKTWDKCSKRAKKIILTQPPRNMLEDMVQMTEKGMLWHFPIDNEQGVNENKVHHSLIRGVLTQSCSSGAKNFTKCVLYHVSPV